MDDFCSGGLNSYTVGDAGQKNAPAFLYSLHPYNSAVAEEQKSASAKDGVNADFAWSKNLPTYLLAKSHTFIKLAIISSIKVVMPKFDEVRWFMRLKAHPFVTRCFYSTTPQ
ncbi:MAG: hypothetical protein CVV06_17440 [Gammaproteobacteria bacterium HGW-Gammaproteobacteria-10]|nr:MAG: hypothetical protein CVV06_17440 [Gammaproteobacteria bacterium HGW-Gammaproteobacteria-10]